MMTTKELYHIARRAGTTTDTAHKYIHRQTAIKWIFSAMPTPPKGMKGKYQAMAKVVSVVNLNRAYTQPSIETRLRARIADKYMEVIADRGGEVSIQEQDGTVYLRVIDRSSRYVLLGCEGWRHYSRRFGARKASLAYLCGRDDNGLWAVRVPGTISTIGGALDAITPAEVAKAQNAGKTVLRQGDVYVIETTKAHDGKGDLPRNHAWDPETRTLRHLDTDAPHVQLFVPFPCRFVTQSTLRMGRSGGRGRGD